MTTTKQTFINVICVRKPYDGALWYGAPALELNKKYSAYDEGSLLYEIGGFLYNKDLFETQFDVDLREILNAN